MKFGGTAPPRNGATRHHPCILPCLNARVNTQQGQQFENPSEEQLGAANAAEATIHWFRHLRRGRLKFDGCTSPALISMVGSRFQGKRTGRTPAKDMCSSAANTWLRSNGMVTPWRILQTISAPCIDDKRRPRTLLCVFHRSCKISYQRCMRRVSASQDQLTIVRSARLDCGA